MQTLDGLITQVYAVLRDERREFVTESMVILWLNEAQRDLSSRLHELVTDKKTGVVGEDATNSYYAADGTTDYAADTVLVPSDLVMVRGLEIAGVTVRFTDDEVFDSYQGTDPELLTVIGRIFGVQTYSAAPGPALAGYERFIELLPDQTTNAYELKYTRTPVELADPNDVVEVPEYMETKMVNYARSHAKAQLGEDAQRDYYMSLYVENLPPPPRGHILTRPGPLTLSYEGNAFDYDSDASHRG